MLNNVCVCGSGKKQKNCCGSCIEIRRDVLDNNGKVSYNEPFWITQEPILPDLLLTDAEMIQFRKGVSLAEKDFKISIKIFETLLEKHPNHCSISHNLACAYHAADRKDEAVKILEKNLKENPEYVFSRTMLGIIYLDQNQLDKIPKLLENKYDIKMLYSSRKVFHFREVTMFYFLIGLYHSECGRFEAANWCLQLMKMCEPNGTEVKHLENVIARNSILSTLPSNFKKLFSKNNIAKKH